MLTLLAAASIFASPAYYPEDARRRGEEGVTKVQLEISAAGKPEMCRVMESSGSAELDASACEVIYAQMHYPPKIEGGVAMRSTRLQSVRWQLKSDPEEEREARPVQVLLATAVAAFLIYLPMSLQHALQFGDFWRFEKAGRFTLLRAAGRTQNPRNYWLAVASRGVAIVLLSWVMAGLVTSLSSANVKVLATTH